MTVGIAACGPRAGAGILAGLRAVEAVGRGAIGGFVSLAVITADQRLLRAETQTDGSAGLFPDAPPHVILKAPFAALISSGPNRPPPLSQFVAAKPGVGLVTGHRFPNTVTGDGQALNTHVLSAIEAGFSPREAIDLVIDRYPGFDAGFIALSVDGRMEFGNMPSVLEREDRGGGTLSSSDSSASVSTIHNAIHPHRIIAPLVNEVVLDEMLRGEMPELWVEISAGLDLEYGPNPEMHIGKDMHVKRILHPRIDVAGALDCFGLGDRVRIISDGQAIGWLGYEPFMTIRDGKVTEMDGRKRIKAPILPSRGR